MRIRLLLIAASITLLAFPASAMAQDHPADQAAPPERPIETGSQECMTADIRAVPSAVIVIPSTNCTTDVDITDPNFSPFRVGPRPAAPPTEPSREAE